MKNTSSLYFMICANDHARNIDRTKNNSLLNLIFLLLIIKTTEESRIKDFAKFVPYIIPPQHIKARTM